MSGLLKPYAAKKLVSTLKQEVGLPIHLHTHDTTGNQVAALLLAAEAGVDVVDVACAPLAGLTSQPSLDAVVAALHGTERDTGLDLRRVQELSNYWSDVRLRYESFDHGLKSSTTDIYRYEIPGGQYTNLRPQVESLGLGDRNSDGTVNVQFELNGMRREVTVRDPHASEQTRQATLADESDPLQVGTSIPGMVSKLCVKQGDQVEKDQVLAIIEAMKMETAITARTAGTVREIRVKEGQAVKAKELLMTLEAAPQN